MAHGYESFYGAGFPIILWICTAGLTRIKKRDL